MLLRDFLKKVLQALEPWCSEEIAKGKRWSPEIAKQLDETRFGISCLTPDNLQAPWLLFEAGACSKSVKNDAHVVPYLHEVEKSQIVGPLADFQMCLANREDTWELMRTLNTLLEDRRLTEKLLEETFSAFWPSLEEGLKDVPKATQEARPKRLVEDMVEEILDRQRRIEAMISDNNSDPWKDMNELRSRVLREELAKRISGGLHSLAGAKRIDPPSNAAALYGEDKEP